MRYLILVKATAGSEAGETPGEALLAAMAAFHEALARAGVLLDAGGLRPSRDGWRVLYDGDERRMVDGPFAESGELVAGYTLIQARSRDEAMAWTRRFPHPAPHGGRAEIEVRPLLDLDDLAQGEAGQRLRALAPGQA